MTRNDLLLALFAALPLVALTGCDVDAQDGELDCPEGDETCMEPPPEEPEVEEFTWMVILDNSYDENLAGTPGVDICGIEVICEGRSHVGIDAFLDRGVGEMCDEMTQSCEAPRDEPRAALDRGYACDPNSAPISHYVSLGIGGMLAVQFPRDLRGCEVNVVEHQGRDREGFEGYICRDGSLDFCLTQGPTFVGRQGGSMSAQIPEAELEDEDELADE